jgi:hypothetical protein
LTLRIPEKLEADFAFRRDLPALSIVTRVGLSGFSYTNKEASLAVKGRVLAEGQEHVVADPSPCGIVDYTYGFLGRHTFWNWASAAGISKEGHRIGINLVQGVNETGFTENAFWIDGRMVKVDLVDFSYDDLDTLSPWTIRSNDGAVDLRFIPEGQRDSDVNLGFVSSRFRQPFGQWSGYLTCDGKKISVSSIPASWRNTNRCGDPPFTRPLREGRAMGEGTRIPAHTRPGQERPAAYYGGPGFSG